MASNNPYGKPKPGETEQEAATRKKNYYTYQRKSAESKADKGDYESAKTAYKIEDKLGNKDKAKKYAKKAYETNPSPFAKASRALDKVSGVAGDAAMLLAGGPEASVAGAVGKGLIKKGASMFPRAAEGIEGLISKLTGRSLKKGAQTAAKSATKKAGKVVKDAIAKTKNTAMRNAPKISKTSAEVARKAGGPPILAMALDDIKKMSKGSRKMEKVPKPRAGSPPPQKPSRAAGTNPRAKGKHPRAKNTNPRAYGRKQSDEKE